LCKAQIQIAVIKCRNNLARAGKLNSVPGGSLCDCPGDCKCPPNTDCPACQGNGGGGRTKFKIVIIKHRDSLTCTIKTDGTRANRHRNCRNCKSACNACSSGTCEGNPGCCRSKIQIIIIKCRNTLAVTVKLNRTSCNGIGICSWYERSRNTDYSRRGQYPWTCIAAGQIGIINCWNCLGNCTIKIDGVSGIYYRDQGCCKTTGNSDRPSVHEGNPGSSRCKIQIIKIKGRNSLI